VRPASLLQGAAADVQITAMATRMAVLEDMIIRG
jgi:hypothetical protein